MRTGLVENVSLLSSNFIAISDDVIHCTAKTDDHLSRKWLQSASMASIFEKEHKETSKNVFCQFTLRSSNTEASIIIYCWYHWRNEKACLEDQKFNWNLRISIVGFIEDQAFSLSYNLAPAPTPSPLLSASCLFFSVFLCVVGRAYWRERGGVGGGAKSYGEKVWSSTNHSILSGEDHENFFMAST